MNVLLVWDNRQLRWAKRIIVYVREPDGTELRRPPYAMYRVGEGNEVRTVTLLDGGWAGYGIEVVGYGRKLRVEVDFPEPSDGVHVVRLPRDATGQEGSVTT